VFLVRKLPAWRPGLGSREVHAPKVHVADSGLLAHLLAADEKRISEDDHVTGKLLESFVAMEIVKHVDWAQIEARAHHYRDGRDELDIVLESRSRDLVAIEVKASATLHARDWRALEKLRERTEERFRAGVLIHTGRQTLPLGDRLWALPISGLWA
jgi:predicted AAA+ superfamily ATPase